jgi:hypothetical protein
MAHLPPDPLYPASVTELVQVAFDNIEKDRYYYVHLCDSDDLDYDVLVKVLSRTSDEDDGRVRFRILKRRRIHMNSGTGMGVWLDYNDDDEDGTSYGRVMVNTDNQEDCARFYLPVDA